MLVASSAIIIASIIIIIIIIVRPTSATQLPVGTVAAEWIDYGQPLCMYLGL